MQLTQNTTKPMDFIKCVISLESSLDQNASVELIIAKVPTLAVQDPEALSQSTFPLNWEFSHNNMLLDAPELLQKIGRLLFSMGANTQKETKH